MQKKVIYIENKDFIFEKSEESTGFLMWKVTNLWQREIKKALKKFELTHSQFVLLSSIYWLSNQKREVTQIVLSDFTKIDPMTTSSVLKTMQNKKLIVRMDPEVDTRAKLVRLTPMGIEVVKASITIIETFDKMFFGRVNANLNLLNESFINLLNYKSDSK